MTPALGRPDAVDVTLGQTRSLVAWWLLGERLSVRPGVALAVGFGRLLVIAVPGGGGGGCHNVGLVHGTGCGPLSALTPWMFLAPVFGLPAGLVVLGERPNVWTVTGAVLVLLSLGVALTGDGVAGAGPGHLHIADTPVTR